MAGIDHYVEQLEDLEPGEILRLGVAVYERLATGFVAFVFEGDRHVEVPLTRGHQAAVCVSRTMQYRLTGVIAR